LKGFGHYLGGPVRNSSMRAGLHLGDAVESGLRPADQACEELKREDKRRGTT
jgi:hypothetical protein